MPARKPGSNRVALGLATLITLPLALVLLWGLGQQLLLAHRMRVEERRLEALVAQAQARHDELLARLDYVRSDEYVEHWARAEAGMARPGEVAVVLLNEGQRAGVSATPTPMPTAESPESRPWWKELWSLLTGR